MSTPPKEEILKYYELVDAGMIDELLGLFSDDIEYVRSKDQITNGMSEFSKFYRSDRQIATGRHRINSIAIQENSALIRGSFEGTLKDKRQVSFGFVDIFEYKNGKIQYRHTYTDLARV